MLTLRKLERTQQLDWSTRCIISSEILNGAITIDRIHKVVSIMHHFDHWRRNFWWICTIFWTVKLTSNSFLKMLTEDEKKWIVRAYGRNISPTKVWSEFFHHYQIPKGRIRAQYKLTQFLRNNQRFGKASSVSVTAPRQRSKTKRTAEIVEKMSPEDSNLTISKGRTTAFIKHNDTSENKNVWFLFPITL